MAKKSGSGKGSSVRHMAAVKSWVTRRRNTSGRPKSTRFTPTKASAIRGLGTGMGGAGYPKVYHKAVSGIIAGKGSRTTIAKALRALRTKLKPKAVRQERNHMRQIAGDWPKKAGKAVRPHAAAIKAWEARKRGPRKPYSMDRGRYLDATKGMKGLKLGRVQRSSSGSSPGGLLRRLPARLQDGTIVTRSGRVQRKG